MQFLTSVILLFLSFETVRSIEDCYPQTGATEDGCKARCCLWIPQKAPGVPWCQTREDCYPQSRVSKEACEARGCIWEKVNCPHVTWCYVDPNAPTPSKRVDCYPEPGATQLKCEARGCIWAPSTIPGEAWCYKPGTGPTTAPPKELRIDCFPDSLHGNANKEDCEKRGCIWKETTAKGAPYCFFSTAKESVAGYDLKSLVTRQNSITGFLERRNTPSLFGDEVNNLEIEIHEISATHVRISISDADGRHKAVHLPQLDDYMARKAPQISRRTPRSINSSSSFLDYNVLIQEKPFGVAIQRKSSGVVIFDTRNLPGLTFSKQYLQVSSRLASDNIYGIGENQHAGFRRGLNWQQWSLFSRDQPPGGDKFNLYGSHPFYMGLEPDGSAHGVLLLNAHGMNIAFQPNPNLITYRAIGGIIDFHVFLGPGPNTVVQQYTSAIGLPLMPPYWGLGFQLSRYGYNGTEDVRNVLKRNKDAGIPQDIQTIDIDYMDAYKDFTYDQNAFQGLPDLVKELHQNNQRLILIIDPFIASDVDPNTYEALKLGLEMHAFIKNPTDDDPFIGKCWPGNNTYPDFTNPNTTIYWSTIHNKFHKTIGFDGLWDDMNEPSSFQAGSAVYGECTKNSLNNPPYNPLIIDAVFTTKTLCMDTRQHNGTHYEWHNRFGFLETIASNTALKSLFPGKRPTLLSRSTFVGSGHYTAHWTGDVTSNWDQLYWSIVGMLEFNLFGIPWVGADICGFIGDTTQELCVRWQQLGAFYPWSRNHNVIGAKDQDPAVWEQSAIDAIKKALQTRYRFLPYLYTLFLEANTRGSTVVRPLFFEFPNDPETYGIDTQFLWGSSLMIVPILEEGSTRRAAYFPKGRWFWEAKNSGLEIDNKDSGRKKDIDIPLSDIGLFVRGGSILPWQEPGMTTHESRQNPMGLVVALNETNDATGALYWDDGQSLDAYETRKYFQMVFSVHQNTLTLVRTKNGCPEITDPLSIETIQIHGLSTKPTNVKVNGQSLPESSIVFDPKLKTVKFSRTEIRLNATEETQKVEWTQ